MSDFYDLPDNFIGKKDKQKLERFGNHEVAQGVAQHWQWKKSIDGADVFHLYSRYEGNVPLVKITRDRANNRFVAKFHPQSGHLSGRLDDVLALVGSRLYGT